MSTYHEIRFKREICTPPASSPESASLSPVHRAHDQMRYEHVADGLAISGISYADYHQSLLAPTTPPVTDGWTSEAETLPQTSLSLEPQIQPWTSATYEELPILSTSSMSWESPLAYDHGMSMDSKAQNTTAGYSPYTATVTHGLPLHQPSVCSSYTPNNYDTSNAISGYHTSPGVYTHGHDLEVASYPDIYKTHYSNLPSPQQQSGGLAAVQMSVSPGMDGLPSNTHHHDRPLRAFSVPAKNESNQDNPMAQVARVRRRRTRRQTVTPGTVQVCKICNHQFDRSYNYTQHLKIHDEDRERPFSCEVKGCNQKAFTRIHDLDRHHKSKHSNERPYVCGFCQSAFNRKDTLRRHMEDGCQARKYPMSVSPERKPKKNMSVRAKPSTPSFSSPPIATQSATTENGHRDCN